jgi:hypothetical protein
MYREEGEAQNLPGRTEKHKNLRAVGVLAKIGVEHTPNIRRKY